MCNGRVIDIGFFVGYNIKNTCFYKKRCEKDLSYRKETE